MKKFIWFIMFVLSGCQSTPQSTNGNFNNVLVYKSTLLGVDIYNYK